MNTSILINQIPQVIKGVLSYHIWLKYDFRLPISGTLGNFQYYFVFLSKSEPLFSCVLKREIIFPHLSNSNPFGFEGCFYFNTLIQDFPVFSDRISFNIKILSYVKNNIT